MTKKHYLCLTNCHDKMKRLFLFQTIVLLCLFRFPCIMRAENIPIGEDIVKDSTETVSQKAKQRYTFGDFFDALDLPTGVGDIARTMGHTLSLPTMPIPVRTAICL